ncbi:hypothetical protein [Vibrio parahaemolyticus]|uniref:hypothetical protein n=1 Tax=Vibrio parahaemolyticus TaxID=670 RepID=UPI00084B1B2E|nr:hypothetical protein [Vibrio parahaemolyticus]ODZ11034.1 hypothetical protein BBM99_05515 [Vibrio parahaemolyticus]
MMWEAQKNEWYRLLVGFGQAGGFTDEELRIVEPFVTELLAAQNEAREPKHSAELKQAMRNLLENMPTQTERLTKEGIDMFYFLEHSMSDYLSE